MLRHAVSVFRIRQVRSQSDVMLYKASIPATKRMAVRVMVEDYVLLSVR